MALSTEAIERPLKRRRLSSTPETEYPENEELEEDDQESTEEWDLQAARAQNDMRLKSIFEGIFSKYGRDFTDVGDEIDLQTGKIVVDNGHLSGMREEDDAGRATEAWLHEAASSDEDAAEDQDRDEGDGPSEKASGPSADDETAKSSLNNALVDPEFASKDIKSPVEAQTGPSLPEPFFKDPGPMDPVWQVPELPTLFSTPAETKRPSPKLPKLVREVTPPGSGSLWSVPRRGRPRTEGKPRATPSKSRPRAKRKYHSSPMAHDWSFAATPDGDESDDPLQECEPSPSKRLIAKTIRGKLMQSAHTDLPLPRQPLPDTQLPPSQSATKPELSLEGHAKNDTQNHVALKNNYNLLDSRSDTLAVSPIPSGNTPNTPKSWGLTPDEAKLLVRMRHIQKKRWQDIPAAFQCRKQSALYMWYKLHWADRHKSPPQLSTAWTQSEMQTLKELEDKTGLSWHEIRNSFPNRTRPEIEFELMKLWVGDGVEVGEAASAPEPAIQQDEEAEEQPEDQSDEQEDQSDAQLDTQSDTSDQIIPSIENPLESFQESIENDDSFIFSKEQARSFESFLDQSDDDDLPVPSPSRLSSIHLNSPTLSRQTSRTPRPSPTKRLKFTV